MIRLSALALVLTALAACSGPDHEHGLEVDVRLASPSSPEVVYGTRQFTTNRGLEVVLTTGYLATGHVEIFACPKNAAARLLKWFSIPEAHAHSVVTPTRTGVPVVESLLAAPGKTLEVATMEPPPGRYCTARYALHSADDDAVGLPGDVDMVGRTLYLAGTWRAEGGEATPFVVDTPSTFKRELPIDLALSETVRHAALTVGKTGEKWFDDVDFAEDAEAVAALVLANLERSITIAADVH